MGDIEIVSPFKYLQFTPWTSSSLFNSLKFHWTSSSTYVLIGKLTLILQKNKQRKGENLLGQYFQGVYKLYDLRLYKYTARNSYSSIKLQKCERASRKIPKTSLSGLDHDLCSSNSMGSIRRNNCPLYLRPGSLDIFQILFGKSLIEATQVRASCSW